MKKKLKQFKKYFSVTAVSYTHLDVYKRQGVGYLKGAGLSTRGPGWTDRWCICCHTNGIAG